ncbi:hypothetical protein IIA16_04525 [bacterium]|nr:hypothetical protein [bacterium]
MLDGVIDTAVGYEGGIGLFWADGSGTLASYALEGEVMGGQVGVTDHGRRMWVSSSEVGNSWDATLAKVRVWETGKGLVFECCTEEDLSVGPVAFLPGGASLVFGVSTGHIRIVDLETLVVVQSDAAHDNLIHTLALGPNGSILLTGTYISGEVFVWDLDGKLLQRLEGHEKTVLGALIGPRDEVVLTASFDGTLRRWGLGTGESEILANRHTSQGEAWPDGWGTMVLGGSPDGQVAFAEGPFPYGVTANSATLVFPIRGTFAPVVLLLPGAVKEVEINADASLVLVRRRAHVSDFSSPMVLEVWELPGDGAGDGGSACWHR